MQNEFSKIDASESCENSKLLYHNMDEPKMYSGKHLVSLFLVYLIFKIFIYNIFFKLKAML